MKTTLLRLFILTMTTAMTVSTAQAAPKELKAFPKANAGEVRYVIALPARPDESIYSVELVPGKLEQVDCNHRRLGAQLEAVNLDGWGYTYYRLNTKFQGVTTLMGCLDNTTHEAMVNGGGLQVGYNSRLPLVVYAPKGYVIQYRVWTTPPQMQIAKPG